MAQPSIAVEVAYALPEKQEIVSLQLPPGSTLMEAVQASKLPEKYREIDLATNKFGIFAKLAKADTILRDRDRVEIYRPLLADPRAARAARADAQKRSAAKAAS